MGLWKRLFGPQEVHVYLHVDGNIDINAGRPGTVNNNKIIAKADRLKVEDSVIQDELNNIQIPEVSLGDTVDE